MCSQLCNRTSSIFFTGTWNTYETKDIMMHEDLHQLEYLNGRIFTAYQKAFL